MHQMKFLTRKPHKPDIYGKKVGSLLEKYYSVSFSIDQFLAWTWKTTDNRLALKFTAVNIGKKNEKNKEKISITISLFWRGMVRFLKARELQVKYISQESQFDVILVPCIIFYQIVIFHTFLTKIYEGDNLVWWKIIRIKELKLWVKINSFNYVRHFYYYLCEKDKLPSDLKFLINEQRQAEVKTTTIYLL